MTLPATPPSVDGNAPQAEVDATTFDRVRHLVYVTTGIVIGEGKTSMVNARLSKRLAATGVTTVQQYLDLLQRPEGHRERSDFVSAMTTNVTQFFREQHHFERLKSIIKQRTDSNSMLRIWSAGCSSGQEPYSIAMTLAGAGRDSSTTRVLATDIDRIVLLRASSATYLAREADAIPTPLRDIGIDARSDMFVIKPKIRAMVQVKALNLIDCWPFERAFDVIFCRNVAIYFDSVTQHRLWSRIADALTPGGWLFVGHSERLPDSLTGRLEYAGQTSYRKSDQEENGGL